MKFSLPVRKLCLNTVSGFFYGQADKNRPFPDGARTCAQRPSCAATQHSRAIEGVFPPVQAADSSLPLSTLRDSRRLRKRSSTETCRLNLELALRTPQHKKRRLTYSVLNY